MCDQTELTYSAGDVVWVKLGPVWWPGQVQDYDSLPEEITHNLRKKPIAVVKFFQEETFEYVKNLNQIYHYNCRKKEEFIKKGLDMVRSSNFRDVPSNMKMFPNDIVMAEHLTGGDANILNNEAFAPEHKSNYSDLFGTKKTPVKKLKKELKKGRGNFKLKKMTDSPMRNVRQSLPNLPLTIPRPITHPRFISKALEGKSDHEVRIRCQLIASKDEVENTDVEKKYKCHLCGFQSSRLNVIVLHNKSHSASFIQAENTNRARIKSRETERVSPLLSSFTEQTPTTVTSRGRVKSLPKKLLDYTDEPTTKMYKEKAHIKQKEEFSESINSSLSQEKIKIKPSKKLKIPLEKSPIKKPLFGKRKTAKEKAELAAKQKQENEAMKETLLKDWDDDDINQEEVELEKLKQALESTTSTAGSDDDEIKESVTALPSISENICEKSVLKTKEKLSGKLNKSSVSFVTSDVKSKVFEFDDSEDNVPVSINFRLKKQSEKFTDDNFKKPKPPKPLPKTSPKLKSKSQPLALEKKDDKETIEFNEAFNALLEETVVPDLPEIPKTVLKQSVDATNSSDQTSDISSSTDLLQVSGTKQDEQVCNYLTDIKPDLEIKNEGLKMECTSTESGNIKPPILFELDQSAIDVDQKNFEEISGDNPRVDVDMESSSTSLTTNDNKNYTSDSRTSEDLIATEISSSCDVDKPIWEESKIDFELKDPQTSKNLSSAIPDNNDLKDTKSDNLMKIEGSFQSELSKSAEVTTTFNTIDAKKDTQESLLKLKSGNINQNWGHDYIQTSYSDIESNSNSQCNMTLNSSSTDNKFDSSSIKEEINWKQDENTNTTDEGEKSIHTEGIACESVENVQFILPDAAPSDDNMVQISSEQPLNIPKLDVVDSTKIENQGITGNLHEMELDINSMPVIIGGEDLIQPEYPKQNVGPVQLNYSESIIISPKERSSSSCNSDSVVMQLEGASTSKQVKPPVMSSPSKEGKGKGGRSQRVSSKTIKLSASALKNLGLQQKGGNQQVLILKTASGQDKQEKGAIQTSKGPLNMFQHGNKILIVNNPQMSGQNKIKLNPQQQQLLTGGKLAPGTRVITSKVVATTTVQGTVPPNKLSTSKSPSKPTQKLVFSKGSILSNTSTSLVINNGAGKLVATVPGSQTITTSKGQTLITQSLQNIKGSIILPSSQNITSSGKTTSIITSQSVSSSKGMILTPIASKSANILSGNQKLRIVSSKTPLSTTRLVVQSSQGKISLDPQQKGQQLKVLSGLKGQSSGSTILIQTSQGLVAKAKATPTVAVSQPTALAKNVLTSVPNPAKIRVMASLKQKPQILQQPQIIQHPQIIQQIVQEPQIVQPSASSKKMSVQKVKQSPNILQKPQRKPSTRAARSSGNRLISTTITPSEPIIISTPSSFPVINQPTVVQDQIAQSSDGLVYLTIDEAGNYRPLDNKSLITIGETPTETPSTIFIPSNSQAQDVGNYFLAIDESGNIVNISQPTPSTSSTTGNIVPGQDILAKALANTQVLQQETIIPDMDVSAALASSIDSNILVNSSFGDHAQYPAPSLSHNVLETSLTLNQPIMTPLEVPSAVTPNLEQITSISTKYIASNLLTEKEELSRPSMPLLTEESLNNQVDGEPVFLLDNSSNVRPASTESQVSFQLTMDENNVIITSKSGDSILTQTYNVSDCPLTSQLSESRDIKTESADSHQENITYSFKPETGAISQVVLTNQSDFILQEALDPHKTYIQNKIEPSVQIINESTQSSSVPPTTTGSINESFNKIVQHNESAMLESKLILSDNLEEATDVKSIELKEDYVKHSLKRRLGEEDTVTSSSDLQGDGKKIRMDER